MEDQIIKVLISVFTAFFAFIPVAIIAFTFYLNSMSAEKEHRCRRAQGVANDYNKLNLSVKEFLPQDKKEQYEKKLKNHLVPNLLVETVGLYRIERRTSLAFAFICTFLFFVELVVILSYLYSIYPYLNKGPCLWVINIIAIIIFGVVTLFTFCVFSLPASWLRSKILNNRYAINTYSGLTGKWLSSVGFQFDKTNKDVIEGMREKREMPDGSIDIIEKNLPEYFAYAKKYKKIINVAKIMNRGVDRERREG